VPRYVIEDLYKRRKVSDSIRQLFQRFDGQTKSIDEEIWSKVAKTTVVYYSPERVFLYTYFRKNAIRFELFTGGKAIEGVKNFDPSKGGVKWGVIYLRHDKELPSVMEAVKASYQFIKEAIKNHEPTGWYAKVEEDEEGNDEA